MTHGKLTLICWAGVTMVAVAGLTLALITDHPLSAIPLGIVTAAGLFGLCVSSVGD